MRILFMHHFPLGTSDAGHLVRGWALALVASGHEVRLLIVDDQSPSNEPLDIERVVCRADQAVADLPFDVPRFSTPQSEQEAFAFSMLSAGQLAQYRDQLRRRLDRQIDRFDPHVIHAQHIWVQGQLALETGVPYVLNAWGPELIEYQRDARFRLLADQAAENAGRILVPHESLLRQVVEMFPTAADRTLVMARELNVIDAPPSSTGQALVSDRLLGLYKTVLDERFGRRR